MAGGGSGSGDTSQTQTTVGMGIGMGNVQDDDVYQIVPEVYFSKDFKLEHHDVFRQSIAKSIENQQETSEHLQKYLDAIEAALFRQVRTGHRQNLFSTMLGSMDSVREKTSD